MNRRALPNKTNVGQVLARSLHMFFFRDYDPHARVLYTIPQTPPNVIMMPV